MDKNEWIKELIHSRRISQLRISQKMGIRPAVVSALLALPISEKTENRILHAISEIEKEDLQAAEKILAEKETAEAET